MQIKTIQQGKHKANKKLYFHCGPLSKTSSKSTKNRNKNKNKKPREMCMFSFDKISRKNTKTMLKYNANVFIKKLLSIHQTILLKNV